MYRAVIFDLDGTLLDTLADIAECGNAVLAEMGYATHPRDAYRHFVGEGVRKLFRKALGDRATDERIEACSARFGEIYAENCAVHSRPFDGVPEMLAALAERKLPLAILSNKPDRFTQQTVAEFFDRRAFSRVYGEGPGIPTKPDPTGANRIVAELKVLPAEVLYLGDTSTDMQTARTAGLVAIGAAWGFRTREELLQAGAQAIIEQPGELIAIVDGDMKIL